MTTEQTRIVQYTQNGGIDQLQVHRGQPEDAGPGQVRVHVRFAGLNPVDVKILSGAFGPLEGTSGNGTDFAGVVDQVGDGVDGFEKGDLVFGGQTTSAQTSHLVVREPAKHLHKIPAGLGIETAGGLYVTGRTAIAGIRAISPAVGETVYVSGASGGVGILAAQLAVNIGAKVIGSASAQNHGILRSIGVEPVAYGDSLEEALRDLAPNGIDAAYSTQGAEELDLLLRLGVPPARINSIGAGPSAVESHGVHNDGQVAAKDDDLDWLAKAIAYGHIVSPVARVFSVDAVHEAYEHLQQAHPVGKVLLRFPAPELTPEQRSALTG